MILIQVDEIEDNSLQKKLLLNMMTGCNSLVTQSSPCEDVYTLPPIQKTSQCSCKTSRILQDTFTSRLSGSQELQITILSVQACYYKPFSLWRTLPVKDSSLVQYHNCVLFGLL